MMFLCVDNSKETKESAPHLAEKFGISRNLIKDFQSNDYFSKKQKLTDFHEVVCLSHANSKELGDYNAKTFVKRFDKGFINLYDGSPKAKNNVQHIYLIGCEVGLKKDKVCLAQQIADEFYDKGYKNVRIHAIANPPNTKPAAMRVKIITHRGANYDTELGDIEAFWLNEEQEQRLKDIEQRVDWRKKKEEAELMEDLKKNGQYFLETGNVKVQLDRGQNTFRPAKAPAPQQDPKKKKAISCLELQIEHLEAKSDFLKSRLLRELVNELENDEIEHWQELVTAKKGKLKNGTTKKLLKCLEQDNFEKAKEIVDKYKNAIINMDDEAFTPQDEDSSTETQPLNQQSELEAKAQLHSNAKNIINRYTKGNGKSEAADVIRSQIDNYVKLLEKEAKRPWCIIFFGQLGKYKLLKFKELQIKIKTMQETDEIQEEVKKFYNSSWFLTSGGSHRAKNIITNIIHNDFSKGINEPDQKLTDTDLQLKTK